MDAGEFSALTYATHHFCNPLSPETLDRTLALAELAPGAAALDLGCGNGMVALQLAERRGLRVEAVDVAPAMLALARARIGDRGAPGSVTLREASAEAVLAESRRWPLVVSTGSWGLVPGRPEPERIIAALAEVAEPGGYVLWGDPFLKQPPPMRLAMLLQAADYRPHAEYVAIGESLGLQPVYAAVSTDQDWDEYAWRIHANTLAWADANPDHPDRAAVLGRATGLRTVHLEEGRDTLGFGLYLFRKPRSLA
jgi:ubiquinone/menaquinone biosynthesis C-methylase UbiE